MTKKNGDDSNQKQSKSPLKPVASGIVVVIIALASVAFYFTFKDSEEINQILKSNSNSDQHLSESLRESMLKQYKKIISAKESDEKKGKPVEQVFKCLTEEYVMQVNAISILNHDFITKQEVMPLLDHLQLILNPDKILKSRISNLQKIFINNKSFDPSIIYNNYQALRIEISKAVYIKKFNNSKLLRFLFKAINLQIRGEKAIKAGEPEATLERTEQYLSNGNISEAYELMEQLEPEYKNLAIQWLDYTKNYLEASNEIKALMLYVNSEEYKKHFIRECK